VPVSYREVIRLASNETPFGPFPAAREAVERHLGELHRYPGRDGELIAALAAEHGLDEDRIAIGNGADAIIGYLSLGLSPGDEVLMGWPSFPTYVGDARRVGAIPVQVPLRPNGAFDLDAMAERLGAATRLVWICSPNNPTGVPVAPDALAAFLDAVPEDVLVVVDEAYHEYAAGPMHHDALADHVAQRPNVGVLRTFSKLFGLAALRVGWFAGPPQVAARLRATRHWYDVTGPGEIAALASLGQPEEIARRRERNREQRARLAAGLDALGLVGLPSVANFVAVEVGDAAAVARRLAAAGILVRPLDDLGAPHLLRITVGAPAELDALLERLPAAL
jgi:histidinol-phosphate aminotransferase